MFIILHLPFVNIHKYMHVQLMHMYRCTHFTKPLYYAIKYPLTQLKNKQWLKGCCNIFPVFYLGLYAIQLILSPFECFHCFQRIILYFIYYTYIIHEYAQMQYSAIFIWGSCLILKPVSCIIVTMELSILTQLHFGGGLRWQPEQY